MARPVPGRGRVQVHRGGEDRATFRVASKRLIANCTMRMPSAIAWWLRVTMALPSLKPSTQNIRHSGSVAIEGHGALRRRSRPAAAASSPGWGSTTG